MSEQPSEQHLKMYLDGEWVPYANFYDFVEAQRDWGYETFGPDYSGTLEHLKKEIVEIEAKPDDLEEWIDATLLGFSGALRSGGGRTAKEVVMALIAKHEKNKARTWPDWREVEAGKAIEHDRTGETKTCQHCGQAIVFSTFAGMGCWEPDYDPDNDPEIWRHVLGGYASCGGRKTFAEPEPQQPHPHESTAMSMLDAGRNAASAYRIGLADGKRNLLIELAALSPGYAAMIEAYEAALTAEARKAHTQIPEV